MRHIYIFTWQTSEQFGINNFHKDVAIARVGLDSPFKRKYFKTALETAN